jgi:flagellar hook assembly protein FlgD
VKTSARRRPPRAFIPDFVLSPNQPNPFNPQTTIPYSVSWGTRVRLTIYDASGRLVKVLVDERQSVGKRSVVWNGEDATGRSVASGVYFCVLQANNERRTQKMVLLK